MELLQLKYFVESAKNQNFSKTAKKYFVPTSSVSASIKKLETELGCSLFDRSANKVTLNQRGKVFFESVNSALFLIEDGVFKISSVSEEGPQIIRLLIRSERSFINKKLNEFKKMHPGVIFRFTHSYLAVDSDQYDIIIDEFSEQYKGYTRNLLISEKIRIAASSKNPLVSKTLKLRDLENKSFISLISGSSLNRITKKLCREAGFNPNIIIESDDPHYLRKYIKDDFGIAIFPEKSWENDIDKSIAFLNVVDLDYTRITYVYLNEDKTVSPIVRRFFDFISE